MITEKKYQQLFEEAQADAIRFRQERDAALEEHCEKLHQLRCALECSERDLAEARRRIVELERALVSIRDLPKRTGFFSGADAANEAVEIARNTVPQRSEQA